MKRLIPLALAVLIVASLFACSDNGNISVGSSTAPSVTPDQAEASTSPKPTTQEDTTNRILPISDEPITFTVWTTGEMSTTGLKSRNESPAWQELEKRTNIHIEWAEAAQGSENEQFNLSITSGEYYDSYWNAPWTGSYDFYIDNGVILDLTNLVAEYAPDYNSLRQIDTVTYLTSFTDMGRIPGFFEISQSKQWPFVGPVIRKDFLDSIGKDVPKTYDQLYDVLRAFRDDLAIEIPLAIEPTGIDDWIMAGFDVMYGNTYFNAQFYQQDGIVKFGPMEDAFKDYLSLLRKWYDEGLIDKEFYARTSFEVPSMDASKMSVDVVGAGRAMYTSIDYLGYTATNPNFELVGMPAPVKSVGDKIKLMFGGGSLSYIKGFANPITTACPDPITMTKWFNYMYTEEGALLLNYGIQGESFVYAEDGRPRVSEVIYQDPDNRGINTMLAIYTGSGSGGPWWYDWTREIRVPGISQGVLDTETIWTGNMTEELNSYATLSVTQEEASRFNSIMGDVQTYISEKVVKWITGDADLDNEWNAFQQELKNIGIEEAIRMQQGAYDRFRNREK